MSFFPERLYNAVRSDKKNIVSREYTVYFEKQIIPSSKSNVNSLKLTNVPYREQGDILACRSRQCAGDSPIQNVFYTSTEPA